MGATLKTAKSKAAEGKEGGALDVLKALKKNYGPDIGALGNTYAPVDRLASGVFPLDLACGGGFPHYRITTLYGPESSGKSLVGYKALAQCQRVMGKLAVLIDREDVFDKKWGSRVGLDVAKLIVIKPANGEQVVDACEGFINAEDVGMVMLDSLAASQPQKWVEADAGTAHVGGIASVVSDIYTKVGAALTKRGWVKSPVLFVVINQIRYKIGVMFGDPETTPGGKQPQFASSLSVRFYGKKEHDKKINEHMPHKLSVSGVIKKWRVPIMASSFEYEMALTKQEIPGGYANPGDVIDTWKTVGTRLQNAGLLLKDGKDWIVQGSKAPLHAAATLEQMRAHYVTNPDFQFACQKLVIEHMEKIEAQS